MNEKFFRLVGDLIDAGVNPRLIIPKNDIASAGQFTPNQAVAVARWRCFSVPKADKDAVRELDNRFMAVLAQFEKYTDRAALEDFRKHSSERDEKILATEKISHHSGLTLEDFKRVSREKLMSAKRLLYNHGKQAFEISKPHLKRFADGIRAEADNCALSEICRAEKFGFPWKASDTVLRLYRAAEIIEHRIENYQAAGERPKLIADFLFTEIE